jgi:hypothetical protein
MSTDAISKRAELVAGLRELADFYEQHPDMPMPDCPEILVGIDAQADEDGAHAVHDAAVQLGVPFEPPGVPTLNAPHYTARGRFGPGDGLFPSLSLRVYYIPQALPRR